MVLEKLDEPHCYRLAHTQRRQGDRQVPLTILMHPRLSDNMESTERPMIEQPPSSSWLGAALQRACCRGDIAPPLLQDDMDDWFDDYDERRKKKKRRSKKKKRQGSSGTSESADTPTSLGWEEASTPAQDRPACIKELPAARNMPPTSMGLLKNPLIQATTIASYSDGPTPSHLSLTAAIGQVQPVIPNQQA